MRPKPSCDQRTATVPKPIRARLRIAWTATCGSSAQAWTQRSPPERAGSRTSAGKCGSVRSASGCRSAMPNRSRPSASRNSAGPNPNVTVSPLGGSPIASPVSSGGRSSGALDRPDLAGRRRRGSSARRPRSTAGAASTSCVAVVGGHVERREVQPVLGRGDDAGLVLAAEREGPRRGGRRCDRRLAVGGRAGRPRTRRPPRRRPRRRRGARAGRSSAAVRTAPPRSAGTAARTAR